MVWGETSEIKVSTLSQCRRKDSQSSGSWWKINASHGVQRGSFINWGNSHWSSLYFKLLLPWVSWHGRLPAMEWRAHWELFWFREPQSSLAVSQPSRGLRHKEGGWNWSDPDSFAAVFVASLLLTVLPHVCLRAHHNTGPFFEASPHLLWRLPTCLGREQWKNRLDWY